MPEHDVRISRGEAAAWIDRWDAQQQAYMPDREERFTALIDAVADGVGRPDPLVLDLGCGPGSLAVRLLDRISGATVIGVDADPVLLTLARAAWAGRTGLRFAELDLRVADGDHLAEDETTSPTLARLGRALVEREERRHPAAAAAETWAGWWEAATADAALAGLAARREHLGLDAEHHGSPSGRLAVHVDALRKAGFAEVGTLWQRGDNRLLCAVLGGLSAAGDPRYGVRK